MATYATTADMTVAQAMPDERAAFIRRTYGHLAWAVGGFIIVETLLLQTALGPSMLKMIAASRFGWLMFLGAFILCGWMARGMAMRVDSVGLQYAGLVFYVVAEAILFLPLIYIAIHFSSPDVLPTAAVLTGLLFAGLTMVAFTTRKDFSFLRGILVMGGFIAIGLIICSAIFGFSLGLIFSAVMVGLACAAILYDTSNIIHHYSTKQHVAASLELFASVALLFWYILRIVMSLQRD